MDNQWHDYSALMMDALSKNQIAEFERLRLEAFAKPDVVRKNGMAYEVNSKGHAFCAMGCTDMMARLMQAWSKWQRNEYIDLAEECGNAVLTRWSKGGLRSDKGGWLHSRTSPENDSPGGTLNQALIAGRNMAAAAQRFETAGRSSLAAKHRAGALALVEHLADKDAWPNWSSFVVMKRGRPVARSWLGYSVNFKDRDIFFLKDAPGKNGNYALKSVEILADLHGMLRFDMAKTRAFTFGKPETNICKLSLKTYRLKERDGWYVDSKTNGDGDFSALVEARTPPPPVPPWLKTFLKTWA